MAQPNTSRLLSQLLAVILAVVVIAVLYLAKTDLFTMVCTSFSYVLLRATGNMPRIRQRQIENHVLHAHLVERKPIRPSPCPRGIRPERRRPLQENLRRESWDVIVIFHFLL